MMVKQASCAVLGPKVVPRSLGRGAVVPNHHMALHFRETLHDFGPVLSYWLFPLRAPEVVSSGLPDKWHQCGGVKASQGKSPHAGNTCLWEMEGMKKEKGIGDR